MFVATLFAPAALCPNLARAAESGVRMASELGGTAGQVAGAGANITVLVADVANTIMRGSLNIAAEIWGGVDLLDVQALSSSEHVFVRSSPTFNDFLDASGDSPT